MTIYTILFLLLAIQNSKTQEVNCEDIKPNSPSDCKLSTKDKSGIFPKTLCCYEIESPGFKCNAYSDYDIGFFKTDECYNETNSNIPNTCEFINPNKASDCVLSESDKKKYDFCCYMVMDGVKGCSSETQDSYETSLPLFKALATKEDIFDCKNNNARIIYSRFIYMVILILFI